MTRIVAGNVWYVKVNGWNEHRSRIAVYAVHDMAS
jgi:hypothetical protein